MNTAELGRQIARDAMRNSDVDPRDVLGPLSRAIVGDARPQLRFPLRDPVEVRKHLKMVIGGLTDLLMTLERLPDTDQHSLLTAKGVIQRLNQKLNAKRDIERS